MQLRKTIWMLTALSAMSLVMTGCPEDGETSTECASTAECLESEICHPTAKLCVTTCDSGDDCPSSSKTCAAVSATDTTKVCQCQTDQLCNLDTEDGSLICSTLDKVCTTKCAADADCGAGRTCNTTSGQCQGGTTGCTTNAQCGTGQVCDTATGQCKPGTNPGDSCVGEGKSTCNYGQYCTASKCTAVTAPTCANFDPARGGKAPVWTTSSTGPIIYEVTQVSFANDSFCSGAGDVTAKARVKAYTTGASFPTDKDDLNALMYVRVNGSEIPGDPLIRQSEYSVSADGKTATFTMNFCPGATATTLSIGIYFTGGNEVCAQLNK
ncbi:MAG TPA: hypothetical protein VF815_18150 [Myxococcaceae bacterium]|jgi:Cys-rich repeat protein